MGARPDVNDGGHHTAPYKGIRRDAGTVPVRAARIVPARSAHILPVRAGRIVPAEPRHHPDWLVLWRAYLDFYGINLPDDVIASTWSRLLDPVSDHCCLIHEDDTGRPTGFVIYFFHRASWTLSWNCCIEDIYVATGARGGGMGRALMEAALAAARARDCYRVYWLTDRDNIAARRLYDSLGQVADVVQYRVNRR